ncbi:MAG: hypothetical protein UY10_C0018G0007 [Microgenomates group bacterium GW2011_GWA2_47_8]|nr:MAG: hypothetical protein UY10_C0018G0007 [Microgenomates group bacterium GW2011_GWA2_47_8]
MDDVIGKITNPLPGPYKNIAAGAGGGGLILFFSNVLRLVFVAAGIYAFINFIIAGYEYMTAAGDTKALTNAWARIWQSLVGLIIIVGSFAAAALMGQLFFGSPTAILSPKLYGPQ